MDARSLFVGLLIVTASIQAAIVAGAERHETANFVVTATDGRVAEKVAAAAEYYRRELAVYWLGRPMPNWSRPCRVSVNVGARGAGGQTTFQFVNGEVLNWRMSVQGSLERILDSVIPHEVNHTIFACHFRRPLPRWADEGAATLFEHDSEKSKQLQLLSQVIRDRGQHFSLQELLSMKDYPSDPRRMLTLYAQGYTLVDFLVQQKGRKVYLELLGAADERGWDEAIRAHFDHEGIAALERNWRGWVLAGRPRLLEGSETLVASTESQPPESTEMSGAAGSRQAGKPRNAAATASPAAARRSRDLPAAIVRSQSPDTEVSESSEQAAEVADVPSSGLSGSGEASAAFAGARRTAAQPFRAASFAAPEPRRSAGGKQGTPSAAAARSAAVKDESGASDEESDGAAVEAWFEETRSSVRVDADPAAAPRGRGLVPTGHMDIQEDSERRDSADGAPSWAGFPGSVKLF